MIKLYDYYRSSACYRVRIALNLKQLSYEPIGIHLTKDGGQQFSFDYTNKNPQRLVPLLDDTDHNVTLNQSLAIIEYLDETYPEIPLLSNNTHERAKIRAIAQMIACDIHPLNNLRVLKYLKHEFEVDDEKKTKWYHHWLKMGFDAIEPMLAQSAHSLFCFGTSATMADACLIPQVYNAIRFEFPMDNYPIISRIATHCNSLPAFIKALPENQPDAEV
jgi:maleylacetoacetate isomerase